MDKREILAAVVQRIAAHPNEQAEFIEAICAGTQAALTMAQERASASDFGMMSALLLSANGKRIGAELRETLLAKIGLAIRGGAPIEDEWLQQVLAALKQRIPAADDGLGPSGDEQ